MSQTHVLVTDPSAAESWLIIAKAKLEDLGRTDIDLVIIDQSNAYALHQSFIPRILSEIENETPDWIIIGNNRGTGMDIYKAIPEELKPRCIVIYHWMTSGDYLNLPNENFVSRRNLQTWLENLPQK